MNARQNLSSNETYVLHSGVELDKSFVVISYSVHKEHAFLLCRITLGVKVQLTF